LLTNDKRIPASNRKERANQTVELCAVACVKLITKFSEYKKTAKLNKNYAIIIEAISKQNKMQF